MSSIKDKRYSKMKNEWLEEEEFAPVPDGGVQLSPIIQPLAIVPYNTQEQPLLQYADSFDMPLDAMNGQAEETFGEEYTDNSQAFSKERSNSTPKRVCFTPIASILFSVIIIAILVLGEFLLKEYLMLASGMSGYAYIMEVLNSLNSGEQLVLAELIVPASVALIAVFSALNIVSNIIRLKAKGVCVVSGICLFFMLSFSLLLVMISLINEEVIGYGLYGVAGLAFLSMLFGYLSKKE